MSEIPASPSQNVVTPSIDDVPASVTPDLTPKKRNYLPWLLGILVLVVIFVTSFLILTGKSKLTTASSDMSSWKTYINFDYGYSLKYPNNISIRESKESDFIFFELPTEKENRNITPALWITYLTNNLSLNPKDFYVRLTKEIEVEHVSNNLPPVISPVETKETKINGFDAFQYIAFAGDGNMLHTYLKSGKVIVDISYYSDLDNPNFPNNKKDKYIFDQILSTFKFINITTNQINLILPTGWTKSIEQLNNPFDETEKYERIVLVKGNYRIEIGDPVGGGRANCNAEKPIPSILNNPSLSSVVKRTNSEEPSEATNLQICSNLGFNDDLDYGTKIGFIRYKLPANWDQMVLKEMDSIVESITLAK